MENESGRQISEFGANLVYIMSFIQANQGYIDPVSNRKTTKDKG